MAILQAMIGVRIPANAGMTGQDLSGPACSEQLPAVIMQGNRILIGPSYNFLCQRATYRRAHRDAQSISANLGVLCVSAVRGIFIMRLPWVIMG